LKNIVLLIGLLLGIESIHAQSLSGNVTDSATNEPIPGAVVMFPQLKFGSTSDIKGNYKISNLPKGRYEVEVEFLGYSTITKQVTIKGNVTMNFSMATSTSSTQEVVITALGNVTNTKRSPVPVTMVSHDMLLQQSSTNVVDAIALQPGLSAITTGPGISKPEINGLGYNRVLTLMDGERQEDFQWGDEHGILIDPYSVYDVEIIRGAASLQYGANAMAGVVNFKSEPFHESGTIRGSVLAEYQTNNGLIGNSFDLGGNATNGFIWNIRASNQAAHCYSDPKDGYVWGTASHQINANFVIGLNRDWGYTHLTVSALHNQIEIPDGNRDSATRQFEFDVPQGNAKYQDGLLVPGTGQVYPTRANFLSYNSNTGAYQVLDHYELWWQNSINVGSGKIQADLGYSQSVRHEIDSGSVGTLNMTVHDFPYSIKYQVAGINSGLKLTTGINGMYEFMNNGNEPPAPYIGDFEIPDYHLFDLGGYAILNKDIQKLTLSGGLRYDIRTINGESMYLANYATPAQMEVPAGTPGAYQQFPSISETYTGFSGSIGASYQLPANNYIKLNLAKSFRAPAINELTSNQLDPATVYKLGDPNLRPEEGYELDAAFGNNGKDINFELDGFTNYIQNFIFPTRLANKVGGDSLDLGAPVFKYQANTAIIAGISAYLNIHPRTLKWFELDNGFTYIYSFMPNQTDSTQHVPFTPAPRLTSEAKFKLIDKQKSILKDRYIEVGLAKYWAQKDIYSALYNELPSSPYTLFNAGIGTNFVSPKTGKTICSFYCNVNNLFNIAYMDHTSREQYFWAYNGAYAGPGNYGKTPAVVTRPGGGIYNMGRNIGFKVVFPIGGHKVSDDELHGVNP